jgi:GT2 family glycosyltransferase
MPVNIDIIILSYAKTDELKQTTLNCVESLLASEKPEEIVFETLVIESNKQMQPYQYQGTKTIYPDTAFGYNKYLNIGISITNNPYVCLCNNDLVFHRNWANEILNAFTNYPEIASASPFCKNFNYDERIINGENVIRRDKNPGINGILTGWCIFVKRSVLTKIGPLDEQFVFWYADNDYDHTLRKHGIKHALVKSSFVTHLACQSHDLLSDKKDELTIGQWSVFEEKWHRKPLLRKFLSFLKMKIMAKRIGQ